MKDLKQLKMAKKLASITKRDIKELVESCLYDGEWVEIATPHNFEAGKINLSLFDKKLKKYFATPERYLIPKPERKEGEK